MATLLTTGFPLFTIPRLASGQTGFAFILVIVLASFLYFLPAIVAWYRREARVLIVLAVNLLLGWNLLAWFGILLFAVYGQTESEAKVKSLSRQRLQGFLGEDPALVENSLTAGYNHDLKPERSLVRRDPRGAIAVLLAAAALVVFVVESGLSNRLTPGGSPAIQITNAMAISPNAPVPDELTSRATFQDIISQCGQPERYWTTNSGQGTSLQIVDHLYYSRVPAEIRLAIRPNEIREQSRHWTFAGAASSVNSTSTYSGEQLKERMPCVTQWADALAARESENFNSDIH